MRVALVSLVMLVGCVSQRGVKVDLEAVKKFQPGVSTRAEVEAQLGRPTSVATRGEMTSCNWNWGRGTSFGQGEAQMVTMHFGADGKLISTPTVFTSRI